MGLRTGRHGVFQRRLFAGALGAFGQRPLGGGRTLRRPQLPQPKQRQQRAALAHFAGARGAALRNQAHPLNQHPHNSCLSHKQGSPRTRSKNKHKTVVWVRVCDVTGERRVSQVPRLLRRPKVLLRDHRPQPRQLPFHRRHLRAVRMGGGWGARTCSLCRERHDLTPLLGAGSLVRLRPATGGSRATGAPPGRRPSPPRSPRTARPSPTPWPTTAPRPRNGPREAPAWRPPAGPAAAALRPPGSAPTATSTTCKDEAHAPKPPACFARARLAPDGVTSPPAASAQVPRPQPRGAATAPRGSRGHCGLLGGGRVRGRRRGPLERRAVRLQVGGRHVPILLIRNTLLLLRGPPFCAISPT
jgi:hypothetical protein